MANSVCKVGILGAGFIADFHLAALQHVEGTIVQAVCDVDAGKADALRARWQLPESFHSLDDMLVSNTVDVIHIVVPPAHHFDTARHCLEAGKSVFLEKPLTTSVEDAHRLRDAVTAAKGTLGVNHNNTCHPAFLRLVEAARDLRLGRLEHVAACLNVPLRQLNTGQHSHWMFREPLNIVLEQGCHPLSQIIYLLGKVETAAAFTSGAVTLNTGVPFHDTWQVSLKCQRGTAQLFMSFGRENLDTSLHVIGQDASAVINLRRNTLQISKKTRFMEPVDDALNSFEAGTGIARQGVRNFANYAMAFFKLKPPQDTFLSGIRTSIANFYADLEAGRPPREGVEQGVAAIEACTVIAASCRTGAAETTQIEQEAISHA